MHKAPNCPASLRPINLLAAEAKLLARIAAQRLQPLVQQAMSHYPQFAYAQGRQTSDALDRVLSHCLRIRNSLKGRHRSAFRPQSGMDASTLIGGMQVSIPKHTTAYHGMFCSVLWNVYRPPRLSPSLFYTSMTMLGYASVGMPDKRS